VAAATGSSLRGKAAKEVPRWNNEHCNYMHACVEFVPHILA